MRTTTPQEESLSAADGVTARAGGLRRAVVLGLVIAATVVAMASVLAVWVHRQVLDTDTYVRTSSGLLDDPAVRTAVGNYAVDELYRQVDVAAQLEDVLPNDADRFSDLAAAALRQGAYQAVQQALQTSVLAGLWERANRQAHEQFVNVVEGGAGGVSTEGGVVRLNLRPILEEATVRIGLGESLAARVPADAGSIEVIRSDQLGTVQESLRLLDRVATFLPFVALGLYALAFWLARDRRREAVRNIGVGLVVGAGLLLLLVSAAGGVVLDRIVTELDARNAAAAAWGIITSPLHGALWMLIVLGTGVALGAVLAGPGRRSTALRRSLAPYLQRRGYAIGVGTTVVLILFLAGAIDSFWRVVWLVVFLALGGFGTEALRGQTLREFPDARTPALGGWLRAQWNSVSARGQSAVEATRTAHAERSQAARAERPEAADAERSLVPNAATLAAAEAPPSLTTPAAPIGQAPSLGDLDRLERLAGLHERGALTDEEFAAMKAPLVGPQTAGSVPASVATPTAA